MLKISEMHTPNPCPMQQHRIQKELIKRRRRREKRILRDRMVVYYVN